MKLKLQLKAFKQTQLKDFFFKPFKAKELVAIKDLKEIFDSNGLSDQDSSNLARFLIEPSEQTYIDYDPERTAAQRDIIQGIEELIGSYVIYNEQTLVKSY